MEPYVHASRRLFGPDAGEEIEVPRLLESMPGAINQRRVEDCFRRTRLRASEMVQAFFAALEAELDGVPDGLAAGAALAVADMGAACGIIDRDRALIRAEERVPGDPMIGRALLLEDDDPERSARRWMEEGNAAPAARSAFAFTMAARLARPGSAEAKTACEAALAEKVDYPPALWELEDRLGGDEARATSAARQAALGSTGQARELAACVDVGFVPRRPPGIRGSGLEPGRARSTPRRAPHRNGWTGYGDRR